MPDFSIEDSCEGIVCGIDEAGRGPLAGPVVAAAVVLDRKCIRKLKELNDSKQLTVKQREHMFDIILSRCQVGIGVASVTEIDAINILQASLLAMQRAQMDLAAHVDYALIDGNKAPALTCHTRCVVKGDTLSYSIAAASVIAKVTRDRMMYALGAELPQYGFERHVGYSTPQHLQALRQHGPSHHHRRSFEPVRVLYDQMELAL